VTPKRSVLAERFAGLVVRVYLVGGDVEHNAAFIAATHGFQHIGGAHDIRLECVAWLQVAPADQRLRGQVQHEFGAHLREDLVESRGITDIPDVTVHDCGQSQVREERRRSIGLQRIPGHVGAKIKKPAAEPRPLEARVPGEQDPLPGEYATECSPHRYQTFQGALFESQRPSR